MDTRSIQNILNYPDYTKYSTALGELVTLRDDSGLFKEGSPYTRDNNKPYPGVDHNLIPMGEIWLLDENLQFVDKFSSANKASEACGVSKKTVLHNVNYSFTKCVYLGVARPLLFVRNTNAPILSHVPVILRYTLNNVAYSYPSIANAMKALDVPTSTRSSNIRSRYMDTGLLYKDQWAFFHTDPYEGSLIPIEGPSTLPNSNSELSFSGQQKSIVLVDTIENTATCFRTVGDLLEAINVTRRVTF